LFFVEDLCAIIALIFDEYQKVKKPGGTGFYQS
jgi:hypothetical protein